MGSVEMKAKLLAAGAMTGLLGLSGPAHADHHADRSGSEALTAPAIDFTQWTLDNGLRVIAIPDDSTATVTTSLWYEVGAKLDPEGRSGFAHLFEHILSRKTRNMPYNMIYGLTADVGGTRNASTGTDRTNYFEIVPAEYLEQMLWTHRERMAFPVIDQDVFDSERNVVKEELRTRVLAPPYGRFVRFVLPENAYDVLPQRRPSIGSIEDLEAATLDDARAFHQAYYGPDTATLIVAGNFEISALRALVDEYFGDIPARANPVDVTIPTREPPRTSPRRVTSFAPNVPLPVFGTVWKGPDALSADAAPLEVLTAILARGDNSRLYKALVKTGLAVEASQFVNTSEEGGMIAQFSIVNPQADKEPVRAALDAVNDRVRGEAVSDAELAEAKNELVSEALFSRETARGRAFELGEALVSTGDPRAADKRLDAIAAVNAQDVMRVAQTYLAPDARVELTYERGEVDPGTYANPVPMPTFRTLPDPLGVPLTVLPEGERQTPPDPGKVPAVSVPRLARHSLRNGMRVVAAQTGEVPVATLAMLVPGGSRSDPRAKAGIAELAAALADRGTANNSAEEIAAALESLGAQFGAQARSDGAVFTLTAPAGNMQEAGAVFAAIIRSATYPEDELEREKARAIDGLRVQMQDPGGLAGMVVRPVLYGDAPYGNVTGGTPESLAAITQDDLAAHRARYWHPAAAQAVITGGMSPDAAFALIEDMFGDWEVDAPAPTAVTHPAGPPQPARTVVVDMPEAGQAAVFLVGRGPARGEEAYYPLDLANAVLGGGASGRLFEEVRTKRSLSYGAYSGLGSMVEAPMFSASAQTANETADEVAQIMLDEFARMGDETLEADLLARRRVYLTGNYWRGLESSAGFAGIVLDLLAQRIDAAEASQYAARLGEVTPEQASAAAAQYFDPDTISLVVVGNASAYIHELMAFRENVEVIPVEELDFTVNTLR